MKNKKTKKSELKQIIKEEISKVLKEKEFTAFGGTHSDEQLDDMEKSLKMYKSKSPEVWRKYIESLKNKGYNNISHKEYPHYEWALNKYLSLSKN
jgi:hypothetical protein